MRAAWWILIVGVSLAGLPRAEGADPELNTLPDDLVNAATVWTEPLESVASGIRRFDPIRGVWFGLLEGSVNSLNRAATLLLRREPSDEPYRDAGKVFRYRF